MMNHRAVSLLATAVAVAASQSAIADVWGQHAPRLPRDQEPRPFTHADAERLAAAQAKRDRKAQKRKQGAKP